MKERPILFSGAMIRAILAGQKTQTRRIVKDRHIDAAPPVHFFRYLREKCPYGQPGDRLWVREAWRTVAESNDLTPRDLSAAHRFWYEADAPHQLGFGKLRPSIHMPRIASRILLEIVSVRVERLQDCSSKDAIAEGIHHYEHFWSDCDYPLPDIAYEPVKGWPTRYSCPVEAYRALWDSINGDDSWAANPWVWVVEFKRVETTP